MQNTQENKHTPCTVLCTVFVIISRASPPSLIYNRKLDLKIYLDFAEVTLICRERVESFTVRSVGPRYMVSGRGPNGEITGFWFIDELLLFPDAFLIGHYEVN